MNNHKHLNEVLFNDQAMGKVNLKGRLSMHKMDNQQVFADGGHVAAALASHHKRLDAAGPGSGTKSMPKLSSINDASKFTKTFN